jgi:hypothetical protein
MANELDFLRRYSDTQAPVENLSSKSSNLDALQRAAEQAKLAELEDRERSYNDLMQQKDLLNTYNPTGGGKMPSEQDLSPLASKVNLSDYMEQQPKLLRTNLSDETGISDDPYDTYSNYKKMLNIIPNLPKSEYAKSLDKKELDKLNKQILDKDQALKNAPGINSKMLEPFSTNEAVDSKMVEPFSTSRLDLSKYFGNSEVSDNLVDMNAKLPPSKSIPSWSADTVKQSQEMKPTEGTQPKLSAAQNKAIQSNPAKAKEEAEAKVKEAEKTLSAQDISTKEYDDAIKQRNMNQFIATMAQAAERIGYSLAGGNAQVLKPDLSFTNKMMEQAGQPIIDLKERRKEREEQEGNDPNSAKSKQFQDILISMHPELESKIKNMSYSNLEKQFPAIMNALNIRESIKARKESSALQREIIQSNKDNALNLKRDNVKTGYQRDAEKAVKPLQERLRAIDVVQSQINTAVNEGGQSVAAIGANLAKIMEGGGVKTDLDVRRYMERPDVVGKIKDYTTKLGTGKLDKESAQFLRKMTQDMKALLEKNMNEEYEESAINLYRAHGKNLGLDLEESKKLVNPYYQGEKPAQETKSQPNTQSNQTKPSWAK